MAGVTVIISKTGSLRPSTEGTNCCDTTAIRLMESCTVIWDCWLGGKISMIRSMVLAAPIVCMVEIIR